MIEGLRNAIHWANAAIVIIGITLSCCDKTSKFAQEQTFNCQAWMEHSPGVLPLAAELLVTDHFQEGTVISFSCVLTGHLTGPVGNSSTVAIWLVWLNQ